MFSYSNLVFEAQFKAKLHTLLWVLEGTSRGKIIPKKIQSAGSSAGQHPGKAVKSPQIESKPVLQCTASLPSPCRITSVSRTIVQFKDDRFQLEDQASASGLFLLNHTSRGHRGSERLLCALAGKFKVTPCLFQGRGERPRAAWSQPGNGRSQECLHSATCHFNWP